MSEEQKQIAELSESKVKNMVKSQVLGIGTLKLLENIAILFRLPQY